MRRDVLAVAAALALIAACSFPSPELVGVDSGPSSSSSSGSGGTDGGPDADSSPGTCKGDPQCDCDGDGQKKKGACGGQDCNDADELAFQGQTIFVTKEPPDGFDGDWNCDNNVEKQYEGNVRCADVTSLVDCPGKQGFTGAQPACGVTAPFVTCKSNGISCVPDVQKEEVQGCR